MAWEISNRIKYEFLTAIAALTIIAFVSWRNPQQLVSSGDLLVHTQETSAAIEEVQAQAFGLSRATLGYLVRREASVDSRSRDFVSTAKLRTLVRDKTQALLLDRLDQILARERELFEDTARLRAAGAANELARNEDAVVDQVQQIITQMKAREQFLLTQRTAVWNSGARRTITTTAILLVLAFLSLGVIYRQVRREMQQRRRMTEALVESNRALQARNVEVEQASQMKNEFLANMSHELRTPLNGIIGFTELMVDEKLGSVTPLHLELLQDVLKSSRHLLGLINNLLDLAKIESGKLEVRPGWVNPAEIAGEIRDVMCGCAAQSGLTLTVENMPGVDQVFTDPSLLRQVLFNYVSNALKFTASGGRVTIRTRPQGDQHFRLEVEDTGIGIQPADRQRLFVRFEQLDKGSTKRYPGTGLGLALTKRYVDLQGGYVGVESVPGSGSLFLAVLPRVAKVDDGAKVPALPVFGASRRGAPLQGMTPGYAR